MKKIAILGTGLMGKAIAERLLERRCALAVFNRTKHKAVPLKKRGAGIANSPREAIEKADCVLLVLADHKAILEIFHAIPSEVFKGKNFIQMGTIAPSESVKLKETISRRGGEYCEAPVLGSIKEVLAGKLFIMFGGTRKQFDRWRGFLKIFDPQPHYIGKVGQAAVLKLALNHLIAAHAVSFSTSLGIVQKNGIDADIFMDILRQSSLYAPMVDKKLPNWRKHVYRPVNFPVKHLLKDINLILKEVKRLKIQTGAVQAVRRLLMRSVQEGYKDLDYSAVFETVNRL